MNEATETENARCPSLSAGGACSARPLRIQRKRAKGWRMPENTVYVGRGSKWGNPFVVGEHGTAEECVKKFAMYIGWHNSRLGFDLKELRGKNLACWCKEGDPCHADVLLEIANAE